MPTIAKSLLATIAALTLIAGVSASATAQEGGGHRGPLADHCWGTKLATHVLRDNLSNRRIGRIELWYSPADNGTNCVMTYNEVPGSADTGTYLIVDDNRNRDNTGRTEKGDRVSYDNGSYKSYAGASYRRNTNRKCVKWGGHVTSTHGIDAWGSGWSHCG
jgi:hypothetical protein